MRYSERNSKMTRRDTQRLILADALFDCHLLSSINRYVLPAICLNPLSNFAWI